MAKKIDIAFALNFTNLFMIDTTPDADAPTWERIGAGINSVTPNGNEVIDQAPYYDGDGQSSTDVTGGQLVWSFSGHRRFGDPAQDYIAGLMGAYGEARKTTFRRVAPNGDVTEGGVTIANIVDGGGDPNSKGTFSFELHHNGMPVTERGDADTFPESITCAAVSVAVGAAEDCGAVVSPAKASPALVYAVADPDTATVDANGTVRGVKAGTTKLSIKSAAKPSVRTSVDVTVTSE